MFHKYGLPAVAALCLLANALSLSAQDEDLESVGRTWRVRGEYLHWWVTGSTPPPLVTESPNGTPRADAGVLGTPGVDILFGNEKIGNDDRSGGRVTITRWLDPDTLTGLEFTGFYVGDDQSGDFFASSDGSRILARPFHNVLLNQADAELVSFPSVLAGNVAVSSYSEIYSAAGLLRYNLGLGSRGRMDLLTGYRYFRFRDSLSVQENLESIDPGGIIVLGTTFDVRDRFQAANDFHGGDIGLSTEFFVNERITLEFLAKVALGAITRRSTITGSTAVNVPPGPATNSTGGLLALTSNSGSRTDTDFAALPEFGFNANFGISDDISLQVGYSLMLLNNVQRAGHLIDPNVNTNFLPGGSLAGPARPEFAWNYSDLVLQGLGIGVEFRR